MTRLFLLLLTAFLACLAGCGSAPMSSCGERRPSVAAGIFGCVTYVDDVGNNPPAPREGFAVMAFTTEPSTDPNDGLVPAARANTDSDGFYEASLGAGDYWICSVFRRCTTQTIGASGTHRLDYAMSVGPGWSKVDAELGDAGADR